MSFYQVLSPDEKYIIYQTKAESEKLALGQALERWPGDCGRIERVTTLEALQAVYDVACENSLDDYPNDKEIFDAVIEGIRRLAKAVSTTTYAELKAAVENFLDGEED